MTGVVVGRSLGRYRLRQLIGRGGMASVYRATDLVLDRDVAVKVMHPHLAADPAFVGRFKQEALAVAALRHPNIVKVYDFGYEDETYFMVMEYIDGPTLASVLGHGPGWSPGHPSWREPVRLDPSEILRIFLPICSALEYATAHGMINRDIKPSNILLTREGEPILTDYGIAKLITGDSHTDAGMVLGSAHYMSPEQVQGFPTDHRTDIYSLGVVLFEALAGRVPYDAETTASILAQHISAPVPSVRSLNPSLSKQTQKVLEKALAKRPERRFQRAGDLGAALYGALSPRAAEDQALGRHSSRPVPPPPSPVLAALEAAVFEPTLEMDVTEHRRKSPLPWLIPAAAAVLAAIATVVVFATDSDARTSQPPTTSTTSAIVLSGDPRLEPFYGGRIGAYRYEWTGKAPAQAATDIYSGTVSANSGR